MNPCFYTATAWQAAEARSLNRNSLLCGFPISCGALSEVWWYSKLSPSDGAASMQAA